MSSIQDGSVVSVEYTSQLQDGTTVETTKGGQPLVYRHGNQEILPALEKQLRGMAVGETKTIEIGPGEGYGDADPDAFIEVPKSAVPEEAQVVGTPLKTQDAQGNDVFMRVHEISDDGVMMDLNHPLAGKTVQVEVKILDIREQSTGEDSG